MSSTFSPEFDCPASSSGAIQFGVPMLKVTTSFVLAVRENPKWKSSSRTSSDFRSRRTI
jgi:hypothetical protein